jgi:hypothetical protein
MIRSETVHVVIGCTCKKQWIWCDCGPQRWSVEVDYDDQNHRDVIADDVRRLLGDGFQKATVWM